MPAANWSNITSFADFPAEANNVTNGDFWFGMLLMVWIILFTLLIGFGFEAAILVSAFLALIVALLLAYAGLVAWVHVGIFIGIVLFMFLYVFYKSGKYQR